MRMSHFEAFAPVCPRCRLRAARSTPLRIGFVAVERGDVVMEGALHCSDPDCAMEYPIIDGIPLLVPDVRRYVTDNLPYLNARDDLSPYLESLLGDCAGPACADLPACRPAVEDCATPGDEDGNQLADCADPASPDPPSRSGSQARSTIRTPPMGSAPLQLQRRGASGPLLRDPHHRQRHRCVPARRHPGQLGR